MSEPGFDDLADLWNGSEEDDRAAFEAMARRAKRKGRLLGLADLGLIVLLLVGVLLSVVTTPNATTMIMAVVLLAATAWLTWVRRRHRQMTATLDTSDRAAFIESSAAIAASNLRRVRLSLALIGPFIALTIVFKGSQRSDGIADLPDGILEWASRPQAQIALVVVFLIVLGLFRSRRRLRAELERLDGLRRDYEEESRRDDGIE